MRPVVGVLLKLNEIVGAHSYIFGLGEYGTQRLEAEDHEYGIAFGRRENGRYHEGYDILSVSALRKS